MPLVGTDEPGDGVSSRHVETMVGRCLVMGRDRLDLIKVMIVIDCT